MRQSNTYIILYSAALTVVCALALAYASTSLKDEQDANIAKEKKLNILSTVMTVEENVNINELYSELITEKVVDYAGNVLNGVEASKIDVAKEYKDFKDQPQKRRLPVYEVKSKTDPNKVEFVVLPVYGYGLWNNIWGYVALKSDFNTVEGVKFQHAGETPGLGARIEESDIQKRYVNKTIFKEGKIASVVMQKGEIGSTDAYKDDQHKVDGMSGATLTGKGVNNMLQDYLQCYANYLSSNQKVSNQ